MRPRAGSSPTSTGAVGTEHVNYAQTGRVVRQVHVPSGRGQPVCIAGRTEEAHLRGRGGADHIHDAQPAGIASHASIVGSHHHVAYVAGQADEPDARRRGWADNVDDAQAVAPLADVRVVTPQGQSRRIPVRGIGARPRRAWGSEISITRSPPPPEAT